MSCPDERLRVLGREARRFRGVPADGGPRGHQPLLRLQTLPGD
jgi:hypothetical protein